METQTFNLFARPSFLEGMARDLDLFGTLQGYNVSPSGEIADARALHGDWLQIGQDILVALRDYDKHNLKESTRRGAQT